MSDKYAALRAAAEKAISENGEIWWDQEQLTRYPDAMEICESDADFIEQASPATILDLLAEREADKARIAELTHNHRVHAAKLISERGLLKQRIAELESRKVTLPKSIGRDIAAFRVDPLSGPSWLTFRCEEDLRGHGVIDELDSVVALSVVAQEEPIRGEVLVTISGLTGSGKSAIAGEIEIAMRAIGVPVTWTNGDAEKRMTGADWLTAIEMYKPTVRIVEVNVPRAGITLETGE